MINITKSNYFKYILFSSLYFSEGLLKSISIVILPIYLLDEGISPELITIILGIIFIPMIIKFLWGGIVDYFIKLGRKRFILIGGFLCGISLIILFFINPSFSVFLFVIFLFLSWCGIGFLDVSSDALAIEISKKYERGKINGSMYGGQNVGIIIGSLLLPFIKLKYGYSYIFLISGCIILLILILPIVLEESEKLKKSQKVFPLIIQEFKKRKNQKIAVFSSLIMISSGMLIFLAPLYMNLLLNLELSEIGFITSIFTVSVLFGSLLGGFLTDSIGRKKTLYFFIFSSILFTVLLIYGTKSYMFAIIYSIIGFLQGGYTTTVLALLMDATDPRIGATQFSIFTSLFNLGIIGTGTISGSLFEFLGFTRMILYTALVFGPAILFLYFIEERKKKNCLPFSET